jgi:hypothetical protein
MNHQRPVLQMKTSDWIVEASVNALMKYRLTSKLDSMGKQLKEMNASQTYEEGIEEEELRDPRIKEAASESQADLKRWNWVKYVEIDCVYCVMRRREATLFWGERNRVTFPFEKKASVIVLPLHSMNPNEGDCVVSREQTCENVMEYVVTLDDLNCEPHCETACQVHATDSSLELV